MSKRMVDLKVEDGKIASIDGYVIAGSGGEGGGGSGSGGDFYIASSKAETKSIGGGPYGLAWARDNKLEANTAYEVGYIARVFYSVSFNPISLEKNEICDVVCFTDAVAIDYRRLQFGDVVLVLTDVDVTPSANIRDNKYIDVNASYYLTYAVVKGGTTGTSVNLDTSKVSPKMQYIIHRLSKTSV